MSLQEQLLQMEIDKLLDFMRELKGRKLKELDTYIANNLIREIIRQSKKVNVHD